MTTTYFLHGLVVGQTPEPARWDGFLSSQSLAHFCPFCGEVWGRVFTARSGDHWFPVNTACPACPPWRGEVPGSFILGWNPFQLDELPREVLKREFLLHFDRWQRSHHAP